MTGRAAEAASHGQSAVKSLRNDGYASIPALWPSARIRRFLHDLEAERPEWLLPPASDLVDLLKVGKRRYQYVLPFVHPFDCEDIVFHSQIESVCTGLLGDDYVIDSIGIVVSLPGATDQHVHRDGGRLFPELEIDRMLPPSALSLAVPLVTMNEESGMTAFWPGSHRDPGLTDRIPAQALALAPGDCAIWDYRTYHHGRANRGSHPRPFLYFVACRPFWTDYRNFQPDRNSKLLASAQGLAKLSETHRARMARAVLVGGDQPGG